MGNYDRSSKWLIQHHGDALLRLAGLRNFTRWKALQAEVVQPAQLPDGLLEVQFRGKRKPSLVLLEIATYPERRVQEQLSRGEMLVLLDRDALPNTVAVVLRPKGRYQVPEGRSFASDLGWSTLDARWRRIEMWNVPAAELLASGDPGAMPWVSLTAFPGPPEPVVRRAAEVILQQTTGEERANLLAVSQVLARLRYNHLSLFSILGGRRAMIESPLLNEIRAESKAEGKAEGKADAVLRILRARFGSLPERTEQRVLDTNDEGYLDRLLDRAALCADPTDFERLLPER